MLVKQIPDLVSKLYTPSYNYQNIRLYTRNMKILLKRLQIWDSCFYGLQ